MRAERLERAGDVAWSAACARTRAACRWGSASTRGAWSEPRGQQHRGGCDAADPESSRRVTEAMGVLPVDARLNNRVSSKIPRSRPSALRTPRAGRPRQWTIIARSTCRGLGCGWPSPEDGMKRLFGLPARLWPWPRGAPPGAARGAAAGGRGPAGPGTTASTSSSAGSTCSSSATGTTACSSTRRRPASRSSTRASAPPPAARSGCRRRRSSGTRSPRWSRGTSTMPQRRDRGPAAIRGLRLRLALGRHARGRGLRDRRLSSTSRCPRQLAGRAGFNLEFLPSAYFERTYIADGRPGVFPLYPSGPTRSGRPATQIRQFEGTDRRPGPGEYVEAEPFASGKTLVLAPEDPARRVTIESAGG